MHDGTCVKVINASSQPPSDSSVNDAQLAQSLLSAENTACAVQLLRPAIVSENLTTIESWNLIARLSPCQ
jgi:hypothetical protein